MLYAKNDANSCTQKVYWRLSLTFKIQLKNLNHIVIVYWILTEDGTGHFQVLGLHNSISFFVCLLMMSPKQWPHEKITCLRNLFKCLWLNTVVYSKQAHLCRNVMCLVYNQNCSTSATETRQIVETMTDRLSCFVCR